WAAQLKWVDEFVRSECEPIDLIVKESHDLNDPVRQALIPPLQKIVKERGLWATHLGPHLGGPGFGQVKLALLNEILGRSECAPIVFGSQAPDSGNSEILAHYGTPELKQRYLEPLLDNRIISCFSMTEPQGGSDPKEFTTSAVQDGDHWVINGEKWFSSFASMASFLIVMAVTDPDAPPYQRHSMFVVPTETAGINVLRDVGLGYQPPGGGGREGYVRYENVRVPADHMLGPRGGAFVVAQTRLGGGRIHHAMRTIGQAQKALDMLCERALSRYTAGGKLSEKQFVQGYIADSYAQLKQFRLFVLYTAWEIDKYNDYRKVRKDIAAIKVLMPSVLHDIAQRALQVHGALGVSNEMPFTRMMNGAAVMGLADGPTEVHKMTVAKQVLRDYSPVDDLWPSGHLPKRLAAAREKYAAYLDGAPGEGDSTSAESSG
ncbi:MAG TPA: acyl-CoA dehydrogenase family protein, partial [Mycobacterium sp.]|nr:acyl-CoA dehydrogenase family protein [Mycobacterium sp.]